MNFNVLNFMEKNGFEKKKKKEILHKKVQVQ